MEAVKKIVVSLKNSPTGAIIGGSIGLIAAYRLKHATKNKYVIVGGFVIIPVVCALMGAATEHKIKYPTIESMQTTKK